MRKKGLDVKVKYIFNTWKTLNVNASILSKMYAFVQLLILD